MGDAYVLPVGKSVLAMVIVTATRRGLKYLLSSQFVLSQHFFTDEEADIPADFNTLNEYVSNPSTTHIGKLGRRSYRQFSRCDRHDFTSERFEVRVSTKFVDITAY